MSIPSKYEQATPAGGAEAHFSRLDRAETYRHVLDESDLLGRRTQSLSPTSTASGRSSASSYLCSCQSPRDDVADPSERPVDLPD